VIGDKRMLENASIDSTAEELVFKDNTNDKA